jgi:hypothetical protein
MTIGVQRRLDAWYMGYACALAGIWRNHHDAQAVEHAMKLDGVTLQQLCAAGVEAYDLDAIAAALSNRRAA